MWHPAVIATLVIGSASTVAQPLPSGWRLPSESDLADEARNDSPSRYARAAADYNGDGIEDQALLLKSTSGNGEALWVRLSNGPTRHHWVRLDQTTWPREYATVPLAMGVETKEPGELVYACLDTDKVCNFDSYDRRPKMTLRYPAIIYFKLESAASLYYWSSGRKRFIRVWLSD